MREKVKTQKREKRERGDIVEREREREGGNLYTTAKSNLRLDTNILPTNW